MEENSQETELREEDNINMDITYVSCGDSDDLEEVVIMQYKFSRSKTENFLYK
jgi:hypothetical protein